MSNSTYAVVGGGIAGASAAEALRGEGFDGRIVLVGRSRSRPISVRRSPKSFCAEKSNATTSPYARGDPNANDGVETDAFCRTSVDGVFAAGDVALSWRPRLNRRVRIEHFDNEELQGAAAGRAMYGTMHAYDPIPFFWSDQYDLSLQYYGHASNWDRIAMRGRGKDGSFVAFYLKNERIEAACALIGRSDIRASTLADDAISLEDIVRTRTPNAIAARRES